MFQPHASMNFWIIPNIIFHNINTKPLYLSIFPLSDIGLSIDTFPHSTSILSTILPLSIIDLAIIPFKYSSSLLYSTNELTFIPRPIGIDLKAFTIFEIFYYLSLINLPRVIENYSFPIFLSLFVKLSEVNSIFIFLYMKI